MLKIRAGNHGRGGWARRTGAAALALGAAAAWISACGDGPSGPADGQPAALAVTPSAVGPVEVGDEVRLVAEPRGAGGRVVAGAAVSWTSSDPRVATVSADGVVTARGAGTAGIRAEAGGITATVQFSVASPDRAVLEVLYNATGGPSWTNSTGWLTDAPLGDWHGVTTDSDGRVVGLHLQSNRLEGEIPAELGGLAGLEQLYLQRNQLSGNIPGDLGGLASLQWLLLNDNALTGAVPGDLGGLAGLAGLLLHNNSGARGRAAAGPVVAVRAAAVPVRRNRPLRPRRRVVPRMAERHREPPWHGGGLPGGRQQSAARDRGHHTRHDGEGGRERERERVVVLQRSGRRRS